MRIVSKHSDLDHTVLPANCTIPACTAITIKISVTVLCHRCSSSADVICMTPHLQFSCGVFFCHAFNDKAKVRITAVHKVLASKLHSGLNSSQWEPTHGTGRSVQLQQFGCSQAVGRLKTQFCTNNNTTGLC